MGPRARHPFALLTLALCTVGAGAAGTPPPPLAPRFPVDQGRWVGTPPTWASLSGHVVLLDVWTFG